MMDKLKKEINERLIELLNPIKDGKVKEAMTYSLMASGKRLRPILFLSFSLSLTSSKYVVGSPSLKLLQLFRYCMRN